jgi:hypothetical protein
MRALIGSLAGLLATAAAAAEIPLYPTGPSEDSAFLRFVNAGSASLELVAAGSQAKLRLEGEHDVSDFLTVPAGKPIKGQLSSAGKTTALDVSVEPGEFATVVELPSGDVVTVREQPDDFNALKASLALYNLDPACANAGLQVAGRGIDVFKDLGEGAVQRRSINPVSLTVQLRCGGADAGAALALGDLAAGQRYSLFVLPGARLLMARDNLAN